MYQSGSCTRLSPLVRCELHKTKEDIYGFCFVLQLSSLVLCTLLAVKKYLLKLSWIIAFHKLYVYIYSKYNHEYLFIYMLYFPCSTHISILGGYSLLYNMCINSHATNNTCININLMECFVCYWFSTLYTKVSDIE